MIGRFVRYGEMEKTLPLAAGSSSAKPCVDLKRNLADLDIILRHFDVLAEKYDMRSANMADIGEAGLTA